MDRDNYEYDYVAITVKSSVEKEVLDGYACFKWEVQERKERKDSVDLVLRRPHRIENKDRLQLLQVNMEKATENLIKYKQYKFTVIKAVAFYFALLGILAIISGLSLAASGGNALLISTGTVIAMSGLAALVISGVFLRRTAAKDRALAVARLKEAAQEIKKACGEAERLINGS